MSGKKRSRVTLEDVLERPWCYYCERDFDNLKVLLDHQKAKHFKCESCGRRLNTAGGLGVHMSQVHKEPLTQIENAMPGRGAGDIEIFGMEGIPADILEEFRQRVIGKYYQEHGQPVQQVQGPGKKIKKETPEELKARLAEFRAKKAVEKEALKLAETKTSSDAGQDGDNNADVAGNPAPPPAMAQGSLQHSPEVAYPGYSQPALGPAGYYHPDNIMPDYPPPFPMPQQFTPHPYGAPPQQFGGQQPWGGPPQYMPVAQHHHFAGSTMQGPPGLASFSPPPQAFPHKPHHSPSSGPPGLAAPIRTPSLTPAPPGLPQKPSFTPSVSQFQLQQMHQGSVHLAGSHGHVTKQDQGGSAVDQAQLHARNGPKTGEADVEMKDAPDNNNTSNIDYTPDAVDALIAEYAPKPAQATPAPQQISAEYLTVAASHKTSPPKDESVVVASAAKGKKGKSKVEKTFKLKLQDNKTSPEEKLASSPRYSFSTETRKEQEKEENTVLGEIEAQVTGPERSEVDLADKSG